MNKAQTDNSYLLKKLKLRISHLPDKNDVSVLDCFAGKSVIWKKIEDLTGKKVEYTGIEKERGKNYKCICGDNLKVLSSLELNKFDVIDIDAYGVPAKQIKMISEQGYKGIIFFTAIVVCLGNQPNDILLASGLSIKAIRKCRTIFAKQFRHIFLWYLYQHFSSCDIIYIEPERNKLYGVIKPKAE